MPQNVNWDVNSGAQVVRCHKINISVTFFLLCEACSHRSLSGWRCRGITFCGSGSCAVVGRRCCCPFLASAASADAVRAKCSWWNARGILSHICTLQLAFDMCALSECTGTDRVLREEEEEVRAAALPDISMCRSTVLVGLHSSWPHPLCFAFLSRTALWSRGLVPPHPRSRPETPAPPQQDRQGEVLHGEEPRRPGPERPRAARRPALRRRHLPQPPRPQHEPAGH